MRNACFALFAFVALAAGAQDKPPAEPPSAEPPSAERPSSEQPPASAAEQVIDELTVTGERPVGVLRHDVLDAENAFYEAFNKLVADPKFKVECKFVAPLGSLIHRRVCRPAYARELEYGATQMALRTDTGVFAADGDAMVLRLEDQLKQAMAETIQSNPELMRLFIEYLQSRETLDTALGE